MGLMVAITALEDVKLHVYVDGRSRQHFYLKEIVTV